MSNSYTDTICRLKLIKMERNLLRTDKQKSFAFLRSNEDGIPNQKGVFYILDSTGRPIYVGRTGDIKKSIRQIIQHTDHHFRQFVAKFYLYKNPNFKYNELNHPMQKTINSYTANFKLSYLVTDSERSQIAKHMIKKCNPLYNLKMNKTVTF